MILANVFVLDWKANTSRGYRKSAFLRGSDDSFSNSSTAAQRAIDAAKSKQAAKKETFDDFFESLMKGQSKASPGTTGGINLDGILSSLNKSPADFPKEEADSRFAQIFQRKAAEEEEEYEEEEDEEEEHAAELIRKADDLADSLMTTDDSEFQEFMSALRGKMGKKEKTDGKAGKSGSKSLKGKKQKPSSAIPEMNIKFPKEMPDLSKQGTDKAKADVVKMLQKLNPELAQRHAQGPLSSRSRVEAQMKKTDQRERMELDETLQEIERTGGLPHYVTAARYTLPTGETKRIDLLSHYDDEDLSQVADLAAKEVAIQAGVPPEQAEGYGEEVDDVDGAMGELSEEDEAFLDSPATIELFNALKDDSKALDDMQYWSLFPKQIKRALIYTRAPKGYYNDHGEFVAIEEPDFEDIIGEEMDAISEDFGKAMDEEDALGELEPDDSPISKALDEEFNRLEETGDDVDFVTADGTSLSDEVEILEEGLQHSLATKYGDEEESEDANLEALERLYGIRDAKEDEEDYDDDGRTKKLKVGHEVYSEVPEWLQPLTDKDREEIRKGANSDADFWEAQYVKEQQYLPKDLQGFFRFHIQPEEIAHMHPRLRRYFSFKFASEGEITKFRSAQYVRKWGKHPGDTGNSAVQIAILTLRINHLTKTLRTHTTDTHNGYRLQELIRRRKGLMKHLKKADLRTYYSLLQDIQLRDQVELWTSSRK